MTAYLDTGILFWLCENRLDRITAAAQSAMNSHDLLVSPIVMLELACLHETGRSRRLPHDILKQLREQIGLQICDRPFPGIAETASFESWTLDPFDRMIVAHAKANSYAPLVTADEQIRANYPRAIW